MLDFLLRLCYHLSELKMVMPSGRYPRLPGPMIYASMLMDDIVWPQPNVGQAYMNFHDGEEQLVMVDAGHNFSYYEGPEKIDETIDWTIAWFIQTLRRRR